MAHIMGMRRRTALEHLLGQKPNAERCQVEVRLFQKGVGTGFDEGVLWIEEGLLRFEGLRTVFALSPVTAKYRPSMPRSGNRHERHALEVELDGKHLSVGLRVIKQIVPQVHARGRWSLREFLDSWQAGPSSTTTFEVLPPLSLDPRKIVTPGDRFVLVVVFILLALAAAAFVLVFVGFHPGSIELGVTLAAIGCFALIGPSMALFFTLRARRLNALFPDDPAFRSTD